MCEAKSFHRSPGRRIHGQSLRVLRTLGLAHPKSGSIDHKRCHLRAMSGFTMVLHFKKHQLRVPSSGQISVQGLRTRWYVSWIFKCSKKTSKAKLLHICCTCFYTFPPLWVSLSGSDIVICNSPLVGSTRTVSALQNRQNAQKSTHQKIIKNDSKTLQTSPNRLKIDQTDSNPEKRLFISV